MGAGPQGEGRPLRVLDALIRSYHDKMEGSLG